MSTLAQINSFFDRLEAERAFLPYYPEVLTDTPENLEAELDEINAYYAAMAITAPYVRRTP